ncbi:MAG: adenosylmethionine decarboxylase [Chloroflexia bacterium]|nr:adenosylmethionine decarboxylase [Chloroflexia bacterium]
MTTTNPPGSHPHLLYDIWLSDGEILKYVDPLRQILVDAALQGGANIYHQKWHQFEPWGVTGFLLLQESHISIHTWPEEANFAAVDIFPCGPMDSERIVALLRQALQPLRERLQRVERGQTVAS